MILELSPQVSDGILEVERLGDVLVINGEQFDFNALPEEATLPVDAIDCQYVVAPVRRIDGTLRIKLLFPITSSSTIAAKFPEPILIDTDGKVRLPE